MLQHSASRARSVSNVLFLSAISSVSSSFASTSASHSSSDARLFERTDMTPRHLTTFLSYRPLSPFANVESRNHMTPYAGWLWFLPSSSFSPSFSLIISVSLHLQSARSLKALAQLRLIESFQFHAIHLHCVSVFFSTVIDSTRESRCLCQ